MEPTPPPTMVIDLLSASCVLKAWVTARVVTASRDERAKLSLVSKAGNSQLSSSEMYSFIQSKPLILPLTPPPPPDTFKFQIV